MTHQEYERGYAARLAGIDWLENPYAHGTDAARHWVDGYAQSLIDSRNKGASNAQPEHD